MVQVDKESQSRPSPRWQLLISRIHCKEKQPEGGRRRATYLNRTNRRRGRTRPYKVPTPVFPGPAHPKGVKLLRGSGLSWRVDSFSLPGNKPGPPRWPPVFPLYISGTLNRDLRRLLLKFVYLRKTWKWLRPSVLQGLLRGGPPLTPAVNPQLVYRVEA